MDDKIFEGISAKKKAENGTFTQIPNVFFDTCDLPESAQILYLRLYRHIAYKDDPKFLGSIRKLSSLVRLPKSTVERMIKVLEASRLIAIGFEPSQDQDRKTMSITLNPQELWILNKQHYEDKDVPIWDKVMPDAKILSQIGTVCPETGQDTFNLGQSDTNLGQTVPDASTKEGTISLSTLNNSNTEEEQVDPSQNLPEEKPRVTGWLHMFMRRFLIDIGVYDQKEEHLAYLQEIFYASELDQASFRVEVEIAINEAKKSKDIDYFYDCLCSALHLEQAN